MFMELAGVALGAGNEATLRRRQPVELAGYLQPWQGRTHKLAQELDGPGVHLEAGCLLEHVADHHVPSGVADDAAPVPPYLPALAHPRRRRGASYAHANA